MSESIQGIKQEMNIGLVIPTYNEAGNIGTLLDRIKIVRQSLGTGLTVIIVDDNSKDGTADIIKDYMKKDPAIHLIQRPQPTGIGSAYLDGFSYGISSCNSDYVGEMDADLQHPPEVLFEMAKAAQTGVDVVVASRYISGGGSTGWSLRRRIVSRGANLLSRTFIRAPVKDSTSGFRLISAKAVKGLMELRLSSKGYAFQVETLYAYRKLGMTFAEVPYTFEERKSGETKLKWKEMIRFAGTAIRLGIFGMKKKKQESVP
jgi:dolichol-phosphate mannosyltransferase